jgi:DNA invertase Pin-like site-specific DNA recombinase
MTAIDVDSDFWHNDATTSKSQWRRTGMLIGYARTSTTDQTAGLADQVAELTALGCEKVFSEHGSGVDADRPQLAAALEFCRGGDVFVTTKPDRIARSAADLLATVKRLRDKGVEVRIASLGIDTTTPTGALMLAVLAGMAEFERALMLDRQRVGIAAAKARGAYKGRAPKARNQADAIANLKAEGLTAAAIAEQLGISVRSVYRHAA